MIRSRILGIGSYVPPRVVKNDDLSRFMDTSDEWIRTRSGIEERHWVDPLMSTSDLAFEACNRALASARVNKSDIDVIILGTLSPDHEFPGTACFLQAKLGVPGIPAIDVRQQCSGFIYATAIADQFIRGGMYKKALVVGAEIHSKGLDLTTRGRDVSVLFGDGAGAAVIGAVDVPEETTLRAGLALKASATGGVPAQSSIIYSAHLHADGTYAKELWTEAPGFAYGGVQEDGRPSGRLNAGQIERAEIYPRMNGKAVFMHAAKRMPEAVLECVEANGITVGDIDLFVFHQANLRINEMVAKQLGIPAEKVFNTIHKFGNTTAATIPIGLDEAVRAGVLKPGMLVASAAFGSGFTWASMLFRWGVGP